MSGITGLWNFDGRPADPAIVARMSATLAHRGLDGERQWVEGATGLAHQHLWVTPEDVGETQPLVGRRGALLAMDGRVDNRDELLGTLRLGVRTSDAALVLAAYEAWGADCVARLNGEFALALYDAPAARLVLARDALGVRPLYYHVGSGFIAFASEIKALLAHPAIPARPDEAGLANALLLWARPLDGHAVTCFAGIAALEPATVLVATPEGRRRHRYWDFPASPTRYASYDDCVEAFRARFAEAVRRRVRSAYPVAVSVSGGLDSSSIFCQAEVLRRRDPGLCPRLVGLTYTSDDGGLADERRYLQLIQAAYGADIDRVGLAEHAGIVAGADEQLWHAELPMLDYLWGVTRASQRRARARGARTVLTGHWGDQMLFASAYLVDLFRQLAWGELSRHLREYRQWLGEEPARLLRNHFWLDLARHWLPRPVRVPLAWLRRRVVGRGLPSWYHPGFLRRARPRSRGGGAPVPNFATAQAAQLYHEARSRYHVQCLEWNNKTAALDGLETSFPFLDRDLVTLLIAMPGELQNRDGVPRAVLRDAMAGILPDEVRGRAWKGDFSEIVNLGVERDYATVAATLTPAAAGVRRGYFARERIAGEVARLRGALSGEDCADSWDLADAFGLERWLQVFFEGAGRGTA